MLHIPSYLLIRIDHDAVSQLLYLFPSGDNARLVLYTLQASQHPFKILIIAPNNLICCYVPISASE